MKLEIRCACGQKFPFHSDLRQHQRVCAEYCRVSNLRQQQEMTTRSRGEREVKGGEGDE